MREYLAVADLLPGDVFLETGWEVVGFPHGIPGLPGTIVPMNIGNDVIVGKYYSDPETPAPILR